MTRTDQQRIAAMRSEMQDKLPMECVLQPATVLKLIGLIQLALRHPHVPPDVQSTGHLFIRAVLEYFADCPTVLTIIERGNDPNQDEPYE